MPNDAMTKECPMPKSQARAERVAGDGPAVGGDDVEAARVEDDGAAGAVLLALHREVAAVVSQYPQGEDTGQEDGGE